jgi:glycosyltransferase involved in cell wall biosynthesis
VASVADQEGATFEHIVQDACSDDGTQDWLPRDARVKAFIEKDQGMYDAVNRGYRRAQGEILCYLNCDEQYLPGALRAVTEYFESHPDVDAMFADAVVTDGEGAYICHRLALVPLQHHTWYRFSLLTCAMFLRRRVVTELGMFFDPRWRINGDMWWLLEATRRGLRMGVMPRFTSVYADTGDNLNLGAQGDRERRELSEAIPAGVRRMRPAILLYHKLRMLARGAYTQRPFDYSLYTFASPERRVTQHVARPTGLWRGKY